MPPEPAPDPAALVALLECEADLDALERSLLAAALHPSAGAAATAWLVRWDERRGVLEEWRSLASGEPDVSLAAAVARARRAPPPVSEPDDRVRSWAGAVGTLQGACEEAWRTGEPASGTGADMPGTPWAEHARIGVVPLRRGPRYHGVGSPGTELEFAL